MKARRTLIKVAGKFEACLPEGTVCIALGQHCIRPNTPHNMAQYSLQEHHVGAVGAVVVRLARILPNHVKRVVSMEDRIQARSSLVGL